MQTRKKKKTFERAGSTVEYISLIVFLLAAFLVFDRHILRGMWGQWKKTGDTFGHGKQFDPRGFGINGIGGWTLRCRWVYVDIDDRNNDNGQWVIQPCFDNCRLIQGKTVDACRADCVDTLQHCE
jgi:hypothetical protein